MREVLLDNNDVDSPEHNMIRYENAISINYLKKKIENENKPIFVHLSC